MGRLVVLSGPSCVGKGPLHKTLKIFHPQLAGKLTKLVLYDSRLPRPGEVDGVDYHFRTREYIEQLRNNSDFLVTDVRGDLQALDLKYLRQTLAQGDAFFEGNPFFAVELLAPAAVLHPTASLCEAKRGGVRQQDAGADMAQSQKIETMSVFLAPISKAEIEELKARHNINLETFVADVMRRKLLRRTTKQKSILSLPDLENIEVRARSAYKEMKEAWRFDFVIPNHDGEDGDNWDAFYYPIGDARSALMCFAEILSGRKSVYAESWTQGLLT